MATTRDVIDSIMHRRSSTNPGSDLFATINPTKQTAVESAAGVTPTDFSYSVGNVLRYGADPTNSRSSLAAFNAAYNVAVATGSAPGTPHGFIYAPAGTYLIDSPGLSWTSQTDITMFGDGPQQTVLVGDNANNYTIQTISADLGPGHGTTGLNLNLWNYGIKNTKTSGQAGLVLADYLQFSMSNMLVYASATAVALKGMAAGVISNPNFLTFNTNAAGNTSLSMGADSSSVSCGPIVINGGTLNGQGNVTTGGAVATSQVFGIVFHSTQFVSFGSAVQSVCDFSNADDISVINCYSEGSCNTGANTATLFELGRTAACLNFNCIGGHYFSGNGTNFLANAIHSTNLGNLTVAGAIFANMNAGALSYNTSAGSQIGVFNTSAPGGAARVFASGVTGAPTTQNVAYYVFPAITTGFGTPTGAAVINNFPGATATLVQTSETVAQILLMLKQAGIGGA